MIRENFLEGVWLKGGEGKEIAGVQVFSSNTHQKTGKGRGVGGENMCTQADQNAHVYRVHSAHGHCSCIFFFFFFSPLAHTQLFLLKKCVFFFFFAHAQIFLLKKCVAFFVLFNRNIIVNLYEFHFSILSFFFFFFLNQTNKFYNFPLFHPSNQTQIGEN